MEALAAYGSGDDSSGSGDSSASHSARDEDRSPRGTKRTRHDDGGAGARNSSKASTSGRAGNASLPPDKTSLLPPPADVLKLFGTNAHVTGAF